MRKHTIADAESWFWNRVEKTDSCWLWHGRLNHFGYGMVGFHNREMSTHRVVWELTFGPIPDGLFVCHSCDVRSCVRPGHLWLGTQLDNMRDCAAKSRTFGQQHPELMPRGEDNGNTRLTTGQVAEIRRLKVTAHLSYGDIAAALGLNPGTVRDAGRGATWAHIASPVSDATSGLLRSTPHGSRHPQSKVTEDQVREMRQLHAAGWTFNALGKRYGITATAAQTAVQGKSWAHVRSEPVENMGDLPPTPPRDRHAGEQNGRAKLTAAHVIEMRHLYDTEGTSVTHLAKQFGVGRSVARRVVRRQSWVHVKPR